jgi:hypothetical protein
LLKGQLNEAEFIGLLQLPRLHPCAAENLTRPLLAGGRRDRRGWSAPCTPPLKITFFILLHFHSSSFLSAGARMIVLIAVSGSPLQESEPMRILQALPLRALLSSPRSGRWLITLGIVLGCLPVAAALAIVADRAMKEHRPAHRGAWLPPPPAPMTPAMRAKLAGLSPPDERLPRGSEAPDFTLPDSSGKPVSLTSFRGKMPVVLIFGSFGCDQFCTTLSRLRQLREVCKGRAEFLFVYISEGPHRSTPLPRAARPMPPSTGEGARWWRVRWYEEEAGGDLTWMLDGEDERVETLYKAWPRRLVIVRADGRVAFDAGNGLRKPWDIAEIAKQLRAVIAKGELH